MGICFIFLKIEFGKMISLNSKQRCSSNDVDFEHSQGPTPKAAQTSSFNMDKLVSKSQIIEKNLTGP